MATIVVQDDKILRFLEVILDPEVAPERVGAFCDYLSLTFPTQKLGLMNNVCGQQLFTRRKL